MLRFALIVLFALCTAGCVTEGRAQRPTVLPEEWSEADAPDALRLLADDLGACQAATGRLPATLAQLDRSGLASGGPYAALAYAYHPSGIGVLRDGWRVLAADDRVRAPDQVWCVLRAPVRLSGAPALRVVRIPVIELREAAAAAGGGPR